MQENDQPISFSCDNISGNLASEMNRYQSPNQFFILLVQYQPIERFFIPQHRLSLHNIQLDWKEVSVCSEDVGQSVAYPISLIPFQIQELYTVAAWKLRLLVFPKPLSSLAKYQTPQNLLSYSLDFPTTPSFPSSGAFEYEF